MKLEENVLGCKEPPISQRSSKIKSKAQKTGKDRCQSSIFHSDITNCDDAGVRRGDLRRGSRIAGERGRVRLGKLGLRLVSLPPKLQHNTLRLYFP